MVLLGSWIYLGRYIRFDDYSCSCRKDSLRTIHLVLHDFMISMKCCPITNSSISKSNFLFFFYFFRCLISDIDNQAWIYSFVYGWMILFIILVTLLTIPAVIKLVWVRIFNINSSFGIRLQTFHDFSKLFFFK
jgi:hypothetical protein